MGIVIRDERDWFALLRSLRRQRRLEPDEYLGEILRRGDGVPKHSQFRRQRYFDRIFGAHEQSDEQRKRFREVSDQRAGRRQKEIAGGRVSRFLQRRRRAARRRCDEGYRQNGDRDSEARRGVLEYSINLLR